MNRTVEVKRGIVSRAFKFIVGSTGGHVAAATLGLAAAGMLVLTTGLIFPSLTGAHVDDEFITFTVDVTQDGDTNRQVDVNPAEGQILFSRGDVYVVDGTVYQGGTLKSGKANNDPKAPGGIGKYRLRGTMVANSEEFDRAVAGDKTAPPILALATEIFSFPDDSTTILTDGVWPNAHFSARRAVLGGTGRFAGVAGEVYEENIGENTQDFCNTRVTFRLRKASVQHDR